MGLAVEGGGAIIMQHPVYSSFIFLSHAPHSHHNYLLHGVFGYQTLCLSFQIENQNIQQVQYGSSATSGGYHCCCASRLQKGVFVMSPPLPYLPSRLTSVLDNQTSFVSEVGNGGSTDIVTPACFCDTQYHNTNTCSSLQNSGNS